MQTRRVDSFYKAKGKKSIDSAAKGNDFQNVYTSKVAYLKPMAE